MKKEIKNTEELDTVDTVDTVETVETADEGRNMLKIKLKVNEEEYKKLVEREDFNLEDVFPVFGIDYMKDKVNFYKYSEMSLLIFLLKTLQTLDDTIKFYAFVLGALKYKCNYEIEAEVKNFLDLLIEIVINAPDDVKECLYRTISGINEDVDESSKEEDKKETDETDETVETDEGEKD